MTSLPPTPHTPWTLYLRLGAVSLLWGGTFIAGRLVAAEVAPLIAATLRFLLASLALVCYLLLAPGARRWPTPRQGLHLLGLGLVGIFAYNLCFFQGLARIGASRAALIVALNPGVIALGAWLCWGERLGRLARLGVVCCLLGAALVILARPGSGPLSTNTPWDFSGDLLILGCVASWVTYTLAGRHLTRELGALPTVTGSILAGTLLLLLYCLLQGEGPVLLASLTTLKPRTWLALLYLGVLGSALAYIWYIQGVAGVGPTRAGAFIALNPLSAVLLGTLFLGETLSPLTALGGFIAILGVQLCNWPGRGR